MSSSKMVWLIRSRAEVCNYTCVIYELFDALEIYAQPVLVYWMSLVGSMLANEEVRREKSLSLVQMLKIFVWHAISKRERGVQCGKIRLACHLQQTFLISKYPRAETETTALVAGHIINLYFLSQDCNKRKME